MTTIEQLIAYLQTLPPKASVEILVEKSGYDVYTTFVDFDIREHTYLYDFTADRYKDYPKYGSTVLELGSK